MATILQRPVYKRVCRPAVRSFFLFGPRGVGKSTWARTHFPDAHRIDLLDESLYLSCLSDPEPFAAELRTLPPGSWVIVDEIQRIPSLLNLVHPLVKFLDSLEGNRLWP